MPGMSVPLGGAFLGVAGSPDPTPGSELGRGDRLREGGRISSKKDDVDTPSTSRKGNPKSNLEGIINLYNKTRHSYIYMLPIAGQTAGPNGLNFLWKLRGGRGVFKAKKIKKKNFHRQRRVL